MPDRDHLHVPVLGPDGEPCGACGEPLAADQRYCLSCGERRGSARLDPLAHARGRARPAPPVAAPRTRRSNPWPALSPRVAGIAVLLVLGFGIAAGAAAGPRTGATLASATPRRVIVVQPAGAPAARPALTPNTKKAPKVKKAPKAQASPPPSSEPAPASEPPRSAPARATPKKEPAKPVAKHVWIVALTGHTLDEALAEPSPMPYLAGTLRPKGLFLSKYEPVAPGALANVIALVSGQKPTADQQAGCAAYADVDPTARTGCVFGKDVETLPGQLTAVGKTWRGYVEDVDVIQPPDTCHHPAPGGPLEPVMTRDPFLFFHAIVDDDCAPNVAGTARLVPDAQDAESAPNLSLVLPNACHDGVDQPCIAGAPAGLGAADAWLKAQLAPLLASKAYKDDGMVVVTFDVGPDPATPVGALVLSAAVKAGGTDDGAYDHADLLRTLENLFSVDPLGAAKHAKAIAVTKPSR